MTQALQETVDISLLVSKQQLACANTSTWWPRMEVNSFPLSVSAMQKVWVALNRPKAETYCGAVDWVYCPAESYVPTKSARLAVTIHDVHAFEDDLPWSRTVAHRKFQRRWRILFQRILKESHLLLTVSNFTKKRLVNLLGVESSRIIVVGNGVDETYFERNRPAAICELQDRPYVAVVGGLCARKGGDIVLAVARQLAKDAPSLSIAVAGENDSEMEAEAMTQSNVLLLGYAPDQDIRSLLAHSICLFFPSRYEGFGIPVLEAMASGTAVVISEQEALAETAGNAGIVVSSPANAAKQIIRLASDMLFRSEKVSLGIERARTFRWSNCAERLKQALMQA